MKASHLLTTLLLLSGPVSHGQQVEAVASHRAYTTYNRLVPMGANWALGLGRTGFMLRNSAGDSLTTIFSQVSLSQPANSSSLGDIVPAADGGCWVLGPGDGCDYLNATTLTRYDADGVELSQRIYEPAPFHVMLARDPVEHHAQIGWSTIRITDLTGEVLEEWPEPYAVVDHARWFAADSLLLASGSTLGMFRLNGILLNSTTLAQTVQGVRTREGNILVLTSDSLHVLDASLSLESSYDLPSGSEAALELLEGSTDIWVRTSNALLRWEGGLGFETILLPAQLPGQRINAAVVRDGQLVTSNTIVVNDRETGLMRTYLLNGTTSDHPVDVGIAVSVDTAWFVPFGPDSPNYLYNERADVRITVVNNSDLPLQQVLLSHLSEVLFNASCDPLTDELRLTNLALPTGADTTVFMSGLRIGYGASAPGNVATREVCIVAQNPNGRVDRHPEDNRSCASVTFANTVGINERNSMEDVIAFPNPFQDRLTITTQIVGPLTVQLFDAWGRKVLGDLIQAANGSSDLVLPELPDGVYHLQLSTPRGSHSKRVVRIGH